MTNYVPDFIDQLILLLITAGGDSPSYLSEVIGINQSSTSERLRKLENFGLIRSKNTRQRQVRRRYTTTELGEQAVTLNHTLFEISMLNLKRTRDEVS